MKYEIRQSADSTLHLMVKGPDGIFVDIATFRGKEYAVEARNQMNKSVDAMEKSGLYPPGVLPCHT